MKIPEGWPTEEMLRAAEEVDVHPYRDTKSYQELVFEAMLEAAPTPPSRDGLKVEFTKEWCMNMAQLEGDQTIGAGAPAQDDEPVYQSSWDGVYWADISKKEYESRQGVIHARTLYTHPDNSELKKAAEEFLRASLLADHRFLSDEHDRDHALAVKNLRDALEGK